MKTVFLVMIGLAFLFSCKKTDKSTFNKPCTDSCTTVQGRFITGNNEGIANISFEISSEIRPPSGLGITTIRKIASGKTDNNGFYSSTFAILEREYEEMSKAIFYIHFNYDKTKFLPVSWYELYGVKESLGQIKRKDTTLTANIFLTSRSKLKVRLENFVPIQAGDVFSVITRCGAGLDRQEESGGHIEANQVITEGEIDACGNEQTTVIVRKRKNGVYSSSTTIINTPTGQTATVTFTY